MIWWALVGSGLTILFGYLTFTQTTKLRQERKDHELAILAYQAEAEHLRSINEKMEEINAKADAKKQSLTTGDSGADARAATDIMHDLANSRRKNSTSSGD